MEKSMKALPVGVINKLFGEMEFSLDWNDKQSAGLNGAMAKLHYFCSKIIILFAPYNTDHWSHTGTNLIWNQAVGYKHDTGT